VRALALGGDDIAKREANAQRHGSSGNAHFISPPLGSITDLCASRLGQFFGT
jgi:hypothetical protein